MLKVTNISKGRIVLNSINIILSPSGIQGESALINEDKREERDIVSLEKAGLILVESAKPKDFKKVVEKVEKASKKPKVKYTKGGGPDGARNKATFISEGKVKSGRMVQSIEQDGDLPNPLTVEDQAREATEDNTPFI